MWQVSRGNGALAFCRYIETNGRAGCRANLNTNMPARATERINFGKIKAAKSIMGVMMLAAGMGSEIEIETDGVDEQAAMQALRALIDGKFGEAE